MYLVADLQDYGRPYVSLFIDKGRDLLYLFVRILEGNSVQSYLFTGVSPQEIQEYMNGHKNLRALFYGKDMSIGSFDGGILTARAFEGNGSVLPIIDHDTFDPEFCHDKLKVKVFLKRFNAGLQPGKFQTIATAN